MDEVEGLGVDDSRTGDLQHMDRGDFDDASGPGTTGLAGWAPVEMLMAPTPNRELLGDVIQAALWISYRWLRKPGLADTAIGSACAPEA